MGNNRQLRTFIFLLYPDNPKHLNAINIFKDDSNSLMIKHNEMSDEHKEHYHCIAWFDNPFWLSSLCNHLGLDEEDYHLFRSIRDFKKYKNIDDYIIYLTHQFEDSKEDKYSADDFIGGRVEYARKVLSNLDKPDYIRFYDLCDFIKQYNLEHFMDCRMLTFGDWFKIAIDNGYGDVFYKQWYKMRDVLKAYINY